MLEDSTESPLNNLRTLSENDLILSSENAVKKERLSVIQVLKHLQEIERRKLYFKRGYPSLFEMVVKHFGYSKAGAARRINSMRLMRQVREVESSIQNGELTLSAASSVQCFLKERKDLELKDKKEILSACLNKSAREVDKELAKRSPVEDRRENIKFTQGDRLRMSVNISEDLYLMLEKLKHVHRFKKIEDVISYLAKKELLQDPKSLLGQTTTPITGPTSDLSTRYIPKATKRIVVKRNDRDRTGTNRCEYIDPISHLRCEENQKLQFDHIHPFSKGGSNLTENLRLLCGHHNRFVWQKEQRHN